MENTGNFQKEMQKSVLRKIITLLIKVSILFIVALLSATFIKNELTAKQNLSHIREVFVASYESNKAYLLDEKTVELYKGILLENDMKAEFTNALNRFNLNKGIRSQIIIVDKDWNVRYTSFPEGEISAYHYNYNNAISYNARNLKEDEVYTAVYNDNDGYSDYMMVKPVFHEGTIIGYISAYLSGDDWSYYMSYYNYDGVLTDQRNNVIFYNKPNLMENNYKFNINKTKFSYIGEERYWLAYEALEDYGVQIYSLVYYPKNPEILIGLLVILIIGIFWYNLAKQMAATMAEKNAISIGKLVQEIRIIRKFDQNHRIVMNSKDEFEDVAQQINYMLDTTSELNRKNTELLQLNNTIEINHLTTQINPHFLYNTLEIIRNLVIWDGDRAGELIVQLTQVLRYSINNAKRDVRLEEDMEFINDYLSIQKSRFGDRFQCHIEIDEACLSCIVPKLVLQPIIENSIKYGFMKQMDLTIDIKGHVEDRILYLSVRDNGKGMSEEEAEKLAESLKSTTNNTKSNGLYNIARRLSLQYTEESGMGIINQEGKGLEVILWIVQPD